MANPSDHNEETQGEHNRQQLVGWLWLGLIFFGLYAFATLTRRGDTWGLHSLAYFPLLFQIGGLALCLGLLFGPLQERVVGFLRRIVGPLFQADSRGFVAPALIGFAFLILFYSFPIRTEVYGDTRTILQAWSDNSEFPKGWLATLLDANPWNSREVLTILFHRTTAHVFQLSIGDAYRLVSALCGALCLCFWIVYVRRNFSASRWAPLLLLLGCTLGSQQIFFGHIENYALAFLTSFAFLLVGSSVLDGKASIWAALILFLLAVKAHATAIYFLPALILLVLFYLSRKMTFLQSLLRWRQVAAFLITPFVAAGAFCYFFVFKSFNEPHSSPRAFEQAFLPILPPPPPMEYSLQSMDHLLDFGNVVLLVGAPIVVALLGIVLFERRAIAWNHPRVMFASIAILFPVIFYAALNPALSMPRDFDLYCLLGAPMLLFFATLLGHSNLRIPSAPVYGSVLAFAVFSIGFFALNTSPSKLSLRLEDVGEHVFGTYYSNSSYIIASAQSMDGNPDRALERRLHTLEALAPAIVGEDKEYTHLITLIATNYRERGDQEQALRWMERASRIAPSDLNLALWLSDYYLWAGQTERVHQTVLDILERDPRNIDALIQGGFAAAQQQDLAGALSYFERAEALAPEDSDIANWAEQVRNKQAKGR